MQEDFLHYLWKYQKFAKVNLKTVSGKDLQVIRVGTHNHQSGPDFFNAQLLIGNQKWAGNVEIHIKASDWYAHHHETDKAYHNIILHVVWEDDVVVFDANNNPIEALELKNKVAVNVLKNYKKLLNQQNWIPCEKDIHSIDNFTWTFWKEKLIINRLQRKTEVLQTILQETNNDWETVLFVLFAKNFGLKINQEQFLAVAKSISFKVFKKEISNLLSLEALLLGQSNLLKENKEDVYYQQLQKEYIYLKQKHQLSSLSVKMNFFGLRPAGFPTIRLSQLAVLYYQNPTLFSKIIAVKNIDEAIKIFDLSASEYWNTHYTFAKPSATRKKKLTKAFISLLLINVVIPIQYLYSKSLGENHIENIIKLYRSLKAEHNKIITAFRSRKILVGNAFDSQSLLELKNEYCSKHKCLHCQIGHQLLHQKQK